MLEGLEKCIEHVSTTDDAKVKAKIISTIDSSLYVHVRDGKKTVDSWNALKSLYIGSFFDLYVYINRRFLGSEETLFSSPFFPIQLGSKQTDYRKSIKDLYFQLYHANDFINIDSRKIAF